MFQDLQDFHISIDIQDLQGPQVFHDCHDSHGFDASRHRFVLAFQDFQGYQFYVFEFVSRFPRFSDSTDFSIECFAPLPPPCGGCHKLLTRMRSYDHWVCDFGTASAILKGMNCRTVLIYFRNNIFEFNSLDVWRLTVAKRTSYTLPSKGGAWHRNFENSIFSKILKLVQALGTNNHDFSSVARISLPRGATVHISSVS